MKGGIAAIVAAVEAVVACGVPLGGDVLVESVPDEEAGGNGTLATILKGYRADAAIVAEPTQLALHLAHRGAQFFCIRVRGQGAHAGLRFEGISAIEKAYVVQDCLREIESRRDRELRPSHPLYASYPVVAPITVGRIGGGEWPAMVPEQCELYGMLDIMPGEDVSKTREVIWEEVLRCASRDPWLRVHPPEVEWRGVAMEGVAIPEDHVFVRCVRHSIHWALGRPPVVGGFPAGTDLRLLSKYGGIPGVVFGPGDLRYAHRFDERVSTSEIIQAAKGIASVIVNWCGH